ncbi:MAG: dehydratase [SAR202 cluster bacterium]|nr:dehydratase [SAR202 cluster bacterium]
MGRANAGKVTVGDPLPSLTRTVTTRQLVQYAGASGDFYEIHYDHEFAKSKGLPGVIVHGALKNAFLAKMVTDWMGAEGRLLSMSVRYRDMDVPGDPLTCHGKVVDVRADGTVRCELWLTNGKGVTTTTGDAVVRLSPAR